MKPNTIKIDDVEYIRADGSSPIAENYYIVRCYGSGVFAGEIESKDAEKVVMTNVRHLWHWDGALCTDDLSVNGVDPEGNNKFPCEIKKLELYDVITIIPASKKCQESIKAVKAWQS
jgi:hypothetical protein